MKASRTIRRLRIAITFAAARGAGFAAGSGIVRLGVWLITHHHL